MGWKFALGMLLVALVSRAEETNQVKTIAKGAFGGIQEPTELVVTNQAQWSELWTRHSAGRSPQPPPPAVDFDDQSVLFVSSGQKRTGGYTVEIAGIQRSEKGAEIVVRSREPAPGGMALQALTAPFHIALVPRLDGPVTFKHFKEKQPNREK